MILFLRLSQRLLYYSLRHSKYVRKILSEIFSPEDILCDFVEANDLDYQIGFKIWIYIISRQNMERVQFVKRIEKKYIFWIFSYRLNEQLIVTQKCFFQIISVTNKLLNLLISKQHFHEEISRVFIRDMSYSEKRLLS